MKFTYTMTIILLSNFSFGIGLYARPIKKENYLYQKKIVVANPKERGVAKLRLDEETYKNSYYGDLRIAKNGEIVPFVRTISKEVSKNTEKIKPKQIFAKKGKKKDTYVLELPELKEDFVYTHLSITNPYNYENNINIYLGDEPDNWSESKSAFLYRYELLESDDIALGDTTHRFIRIEASAGAELKFNSVTKKKKSKNLYWEKTFEVQNPILTEDSCQYFITNQAGSPFQKLKLKFEEPKWERMITIRSHTNGKEWKEVHSGLIVSNTNVSKEIELNLSETVSDDFEITIYDGENETIHLQSIQSLQPKEDIFFYLNPDTNEDEYILYYGYPYAKYPSFDPYSIPSQTEMDEKTIQTELGAESKNADFGYSILYPPISGFVATGLFYLGLLMLFYFIWSIVKIKTKQKELQKN
ncbi:hypothetical protein P3G55_05885 [Leptospira sp. 96542]|nr:hypothetical protein [Leptospira sp. 96542]